MTHLVYLNRVTVFEIQREELSAIGREHCRSCYIYIGNCCCYRILASGQVPGAQSIAAPTCEASQQLTIRRERQSLRAPSQRLRSLPARGIPTVSLPKVSTGNQSLAIR